jgi:hypothetical protein
MSTLCTDMNKAVRIRGYLSRANVVREQRRLGNTDFEHGDFGFRQACTRTGAHRINGVSLCVPHLLATDLKRAKKIIIRHG